MPLLPGDAIVDESGAVEVVTVGAGGTFANIAVWPVAAVVGNYNIVADVAPFGEYNEGDVISNDLVVQQPSSPIDIIADIACDEMGIHRNTFTELEALYAAVAPLVRPDTLNEQVAVYVVFHKDVWIDEDPMVCIETTGDLNMPSLCMADPFSANLDLTLIRSLAKVGYRNPLKLWPGNYDVIVDVGRNGVYDAGTDILDGGPQVGFNIPGTVPAVRLIGGADSNVLGRDSNQTNVWAQMVGADGLPIVGATVTFSVSQGPGSLSETTVVTNESGLAMTVFTGADYGHDSKIRIVVTVNGVQYVYVFSIWRSIPITHTQGILGG